MFESMRSLRAIIIRQRYELAEHFGFETRNKYVIESEEGQSLGFAAEQQKGFLGFFMRQFLGHWRTFEMFVFDNNRQVVLRAVHPFRFYFQKLEVYASNGQALGAIERRFAILSKKFSVLGARGETLMEVSSPIWRIWTFPFTKQGRVVAQVEKKWSGLLLEGMTDKDRFRVAFTDPALSEVDRALLVTAGIYIDMLYFERKAN